MTALLRLTGVLLAAFSAIAFLDETRPRTLGWGMLAGGIALLFVATVTDRRGRYRRAFNQARAGAKEAAREAAREGKPCYVPRRRWWFLVRRLAPGWRRRERESRERVCEVIRPHVATLATRRERLVRQEGGREEREVWDAEVARFLERTVLDAVAERDLDRAAPFVYRWYRGVEQDDARATRHGHWGRRMYCRPDGPLARLVDRLVDEYVASDPYRSAAVDAAGLSPEQYENHCARLLRECGWEARIVGGTGDQGADIIATLGGVTVAVQCKRYARPVGNAAVQEVIAGRHMFDAGGAAVVSPTPFTRSARELAAKTRVLLVHHTELHCLEERLREMGVIPSPGDAVTQAG